MKKNNIDIINQRLLPRNIKIIGNYINCYTKTTFECLICKYQWITTTNSVLYTKTGCKICSFKSIRLNENYVRSVLKNKNINIIGTYEHTKSITNLECDICKYKWSGPINHILNRGDNCSKCSNKLKITNENIDEKIKGRNIIRINNANGTGNTIKVMCEVCKFEWEPILGHLLHRKDGCPKCGGKLKITNELVDERLIDRNIIRLNDCNDAMSKKQWKCKDCNNIWKTSVNSILNNYTGCPICNKPGINEKIIYTILETYFVDFKYDFNIKNINSESPFNYRLDFYIDTLKLAIEYNGEQHYKSVTWGFLTEEEATIKFNKQKLRDQYIDQFCKNNNIDLIWIDGRKYFGIKLKKLIKNILDGRNCIIKI